ncbi:hypothetical protein ACWT_8222 [Actinoplanes sp. SE50]|uniref:HAMP domain-containing protein n=1 Tax=unclassified Actinoplanes TaxID=2626549 RepID=UPI00023EDDE6|nr:MULTISPECIES: HAMP domain-containing protein [unclassified Actinoplanes]AEV89231.1 hypothetical protein ACPL_8355 [Actinoplanes sp. SE50/110]ATO87637.1 hypothetical protein ACWT_8222 [Actinoplanes sp. SE50]SLM05056.1 HAMP domain-containing protein [Actinoplanes sp. SE50/110]
MSSRSAQTVTSRAAELAQEQEELLAWRRRALTQQLPAAAFPAGTSAPSLAYLWASFFVVVAAVLGLTVNAHTGALPAIADSQRDIAIKLANGFEAEIHQETTVLDRILQSRGSLSQADLLVRAIADGNRVTGAAIVDMTTRKSVVAKGDAVPLDALPNPLPSGHPVAVTTADGPMLVYSAALDGTQSLLAVQPIFMRTLRLNPDAKHGIHLLTGDGKSSLLQGAHAIDVAHQAKVFDGLYGITSSKVREVIVDEWPDTRLIAAAAPVGRTGLVVVSLLTAPVAKGTTVTKGLLIGASLLAVALLSFLIMRKSLVRPVRELLNQAKEDASGATTRERRPLGVREAHRIAKALATTVGAEFPEGRRWRPSVTQGLALAAVIALLWPAAAVAMVWRSPDPQLPAQLVRDGETRAESAGFTLGHFLDDGLATVSRTSRLVKTDDLAATGHTLQRALADDDRLRALYLVDEKGEVLSKTGRQPLRTPVPVPGEVGIHLDDAIGRLPVVYAYNELPSGYAVIGEFDPDRLLGQIGRVKGRVRVVDSELRTLLDSRGYVAYQPLTGRLAREVAVEALPGVTVGRGAAADGHPELAAAVGMVEPASVAHLEWAVVVEQDVSGVRLPEMVEHRWLLLVAAVVVGIVLVTHMWQFYIFVVPLRRLAFFADKMSSGDLDHPVPPQRHDDIGAVAICLEICRQVRHTGSARFGGALRLRGEGPDRTTVLSLADRAVRSHSRSSKG